MEYRVFGPTKTKDFPLDGSGTLGAGRRREVVCVVGGGKAERFALNETPRELTKTFPFRKAGEQSLWAD